MSSWYDAWADRYGEWSTGVTADVPFYVALAREADGLLVELAVGTGRVAIPVAQATGRRVVGLDASPAMLAQARKRAVEAGGGRALRAENITGAVNQGPAGPVRSGGQPRTNGWGSPTSGACAWKLSMADSPANRSTTTAASTSSWPAAKRSTWCHDSARGHSAHWRKRRLQAPASFSAWLV